MVNIEQIADTINNWFRIPYPREQDTTITDFIHIRLMEMMNLHGWGDLILLVDGEEFFSYPNPTARGTGMFVQRAKSVSLELTEKVHRIGLIIPLNNDRGVLFYTRFIIPTKNGKPVITNKTLNTHMGKFEQGSYLIPTTNTEKQYYTNSDYKILAYDAVQNNIL